MMASNWIILITLQWRVFILPVSLPTALKVHFESSFQTICSHIPKFRTYLPLGNQNVQEFNHLKSKRLLTTAIFETLGIERKIKRNFNSDESVQWWSSMIFNYQWTTLESETHKDMEISKRWIGQPRNRWRREEILVSCSRSLVRRSIRMRRRTRRTADDRTDDPAWAPDQPEPLSCLSSTCLMLSIGKLSRGYSSHRSEACRLSIALEIIKRQRNCWRFL